MHLSGLDHVVFWKFIEIPKRRSFWFENWTSKSPYFSSGTGSGLAYIWVKSTGAAFIGFTGDFGMPLVSFDTSEITLTGFFEVLFKQLGLLEPWLVITHIIWTTQEDTVFINDRTGTVVNVRWSDQIDVSRNSFIISESQKAILSGFHWQWRSPSKRLIWSPNIDHRSCPICYR